MPNKNVFSTDPLRNLEKTTVNNRAGGRAYSFEDKHALSQYAMTGTFNGVYYATDAEQFDKVKKLTSKCDDLFIAKCAVYSRQQGYMKDMPAYLAAVLAGRNVELLKKVFPLVIDNNKMLRNFVQIIRSGAVGRKSFGTAIKNLINKKILDQNPNKLYKGSVGQDPSISDILKMTHPTPRTKEQEALFAYLHGRDVEVNKDSVRVLNAKDEWLQVPSLIQEYEFFKKDQSNPIPDVDFRMLTSVDLSTNTWKEIFRNGQWQFTRMNLNNALKYGVLEDKEMVELISSRLQDEDQILKARVFPYQLLAAYVNINDEVEFKGVRREMPSKIKKALHAATEIATKNIPTFPGRTVVCPDVSGSMRQSVTGHRSGSTSKVTCCDAAGVLASAILRQNDDALVIPFETNVRLDIKLDANDTIITNAHRIAMGQGGGTTVSAPLRYMNDKGIRADQVIFISDNESWIDSDRGGYWGGGPTETLKQWGIFKKNNKDAKLICIDIVAGDTTQAPDRKSEIMNIGGFSDQIFTVIKDFVEGNSDAWVDRIEKIEL